MEILLFINDNILINISISNFLRQEGYEVVSCTTGKEAEKEADKKSFDLVIVDLNLPNFSVGKIIHEIRKRSGDIPVIGLTSFDIDIEENLKEEFCDIIADDIEEKKLLKIIKKCLGKRKG